MYCAIRHVEKVLRYLFIPLVKIIAYTNNPRDISGNF